MFDEYQVDGAIWMTELIIKRNHAGRIGQPYKDFVSEVAQEQGLKVRWNEQQEPVFSPINKKDQRWQKIR